MTETSRAACRRSPRPKRYSVDLFCYVPDTGRFWFAEAKGPKDRLRPNQIAGHEALRREFGTPVEILRFKLLDGQ